MKVVYDRRSGCDRRNKNGKDVHTGEERRVFGDRRRTEGLEISTADIADDEFAEVFKQFQQDDEPEEINEVTPFQDGLDIINYQVLYRKNVECAYITILHTENQQNNEPTLYAFRDEEINGDSASESKPTFVQNIFGTDAYKCYVEQGWQDISKTENEFPWVIKAWLAQNMKQDTIESR